MLDNQVLRKKVKESLSSVLPITLIVLLLSFTFAPLPNHIFILFFVGAVLMIFGTGLFSLGADQSMSRMGSYMGTQMARSRKIWVAMIITTFIGFVVTFSEPDLQVLASYVQSIDSLLFIAAVSVGVGIFLALAVLRIIFNVKVKYILLISYAVVFILAAFTPTNFWPVAFDAGGVTTGAMSVPFIMSIGTGIAAISSGKDGDDNTFGLMAICSVGPIIAILILGIVSGGAVSEHTPSAISTFDDSRGMCSTFLTAFPDYLFDVAKGVLPIFIFFVVYQFIVAPVTKKELGSICFGALVSYVGIVLFLTGANVGFMPVGSYIGQHISASENYWLIIPVGAVFGYFAVAAEPSVKVLKSQVLAATSGTIPEKALSLSLSVGVGIATGLALLRAVTGIPIIWIIVVCYAVALALSFIVPGVFTSIAFDAGGAASGAMTATFLFPLSIGACLARGGNVMEDAFGVIALVAISPAVTIQMLGVVYKFKMWRAERQRKIDILAADTEIFEFSSVKEA